MAIQPRESRCRIGRAAEEGCESLDVADIVVAILLAEIARSCLRSCAGVVDCWASRSSRCSCLEVEVIGSSILKTGHQSVTACGNLIMRYGYPPAALPAQRAPASAGSFVKPFRPSTAHASGSSVNSS